MATVDKLIDYFTDAKLIEGKYTDAKRAEKKVVDTLNIDIHMRNDDGHRYIERITEIVPLEEERYPDDIGGAMKEFFRRSTYYKTYKAIDLLRYENGSYQLINPLSLTLQERILKKLTVEEKKKYSSLLIVDDREANCE